jgi:hypothetical protein
LVESILEARPVPFNRNWNPAVEDTDDLRAQNRERGDPEVNQWDERPPRVPRRNQEQREGRAWRRVVQKQEPRQLDRIALPPGWDVVPTVITIPETADQNDSVLHPEIPPPEMR